MRQAMYLQCKETGLGTAESMIRLSMSRSLLKTARKNKYTTTTFYSAHRRGSQFIDVRVLGPNKNNLGLNSLAAYGNFDEPNQNLIVG